MVSSSVGPMEKGLYDICKEAAKAFKHDAAADYVKVEAALSYDKLANAGEKESTAVDPLDFFIPPEREEGWPQVWAKPFVAIVTGQYGVGKTELARQLTDQVTEQAGDVFPIELARCDAAIRPVLEQRPLNTEEMLQLLFGREFKGKTTEAWLRPIQEGRLLLILDGLDELIYDQKSHRHFFQSLSDMLFDTGESGEYVWFGFRVVVTVRLEYLSAYDNTRGLEAVECLKKGKANRKRFSVPFLRLDYLRDSLIRHALKTRLEPERAAEVEQHKELMNLLDRPLLLRIFCDYADKNKNFIDELRAMRGGADVIERYICAFLDAAGADPKLHEAQNTITPEICWDLDAIARAALALSRPPRRDSFSCDEILACARIKADGSRAPGPEAWQVLSKCPFVTRFENSLRFSHRKYFEYFVARGMFLLAKETPAGGFTEFDNVVLDFEIRKFLRTMVDKDWYARTERSYALDEPRLAEWDPDYNLVRPNTAFLKILRAERCTLLDMMTMPEQFKVETAVAAITQFLDRPLKTLHPRYLMHNLEAVAVYTSVNAWDEEIQKIDMRFSDSLAKLLKDLTKRLPLGKENSHAQSLQEAYELLVLRILHLARHMRYSWYRNYKNWLDDDRFSKDVGLSRTDLSEERKEILGG